MTPFCDTFPIPLLLFHNCYPLCTSTPDAQATRGVLKAVICHKRCLRQRGGGKGMPPLWVRCWTRGRRMPSSPRRSVVRAAGEVPFPTMHKHVSFGKEREFDLLTHSAFVSPVLFRRNCFLQKKFGILFSQRAQKSPQVSIF